MLTYFLQVNLCWLLFYGLYYALLSRETFFKINRIYLIISLLAGLVLPLNIFQVEEIKVLPIVEVVQPITVSFEAVGRSAIDFQEAKTPTQNWSLSAIIKGLYFSISLFFLIKIIIDFFKIFRLLKTGEKQREGQFLIITTEGVKAPFSFFNYIFINKKAIESVDYQEIINHEKAHSIQKHSFDVIGLEILRGMFWLSPIIHFYVRSLRNVHEYLADAAVLQYAEKKHYGQLLISQTADINGLKIAHHFNFSQLKKRIIMMSRNPSQHSALLKYIIAAPIFLFLIFAFAKPNNPLMNKTERVSNSLKEISQKAENQLFKQNRSPKVTVKGTEEGWVTPQNLTNVTGLEITEGYEIIKFRMLIQSGDCASS